MSSPNQRPVTVAQVLRLARSLGACRPGMEALQETGAEAWRNAVIIANTAPPEEQTRYAHQKPFGRTHVAWLIRHLATHVALGPLLDPDVVRRAKRVDWCSLGLENLITPDEAEAAVRTVLDFQEADRAAIREDARLRRMYHARSVKAAATRRANATAARRAALRASIARRRAARKGWATRREAMA